MNKESNYKVITKILLEEMILTNDIFEYDRHYNNLNWYLNVLRCEKINKKGELKNGEKNYISRML